MIRMLVVVVEVVGAVGGGSKHFRNEALRVIKTSKVFVNITLNLTEFT